MTRARLSNRRPSETFEFVVGQIAYVATLGYYWDRVTHTFRLGEVFLTAGKSGTHLDIATRDSAIALSMALQCGADVETIRSAFTRNPAGKAEGPLGKLMDLLATEAP